VNSLRGQTIPEIEDNSPRKTPSVLFKKGDLLMLKLKAIRSGVWFRALRRIDRVLIDLTMKVTSVVHGYGLINALYAVVKKLESALEGRVTHVLEEVGFQLARKASLQAQKWGNESALKWASSFSFARFLAVMYINNPPTSN
jgi:hypothetical protein